MSLTQEIFMSACLQEAWKFQTLTLPNPSVACMVVSPHQDVLSLCAHPMAGMPHAEVLALQKAYFILSGDPYILKLKQSHEIHQYLISKHNKIFQNCTLYVTLEPCNNHGKTPPCADLLAELQPKCVVICTPEIKNTGGIKKLKEAGIEVILGVLKKEGEKLLLPFSCLQEKGRFILFKLAMRLDGDYKTGRISSKGSQVFTHNQRTRAKTLIISYNTLKNDNPRLNSRKATPPYNTQNPDIGILIRDPNTQKLHPQFNILSNSNQKVQTLITPLPFTEGFHIIEGGWGLFMGLKEEIDMMLLHISPTLNPHNPSHTLPYNLKAQILHSQNIDGDELLWLAEF